MSQAICINNQNLTVKEYDGLRVVTLKDIDEAHQRPNGTAKRNFDKNKTQFISGKDYYKVSWYEIRTMRIEIKGNCPNGLILITESGYLMLVKSFTDELAWKVQRQLVNTYFRAKQNLPSMQPQQNQITALRLIADQLEMQSKRFDNIESRLDMVENRPQADESVTKRIDELENRYASYSNIHFKPLKAKKYNVLNELYKAVTNLDGREHCLLSGDKESDDRITAIIIDCIEKLKDTHIKTIYKASKEIFTLQKERNKQRPWSNADLTSIPSNFKPYQYYYRDCYSREYVMAALYHVFDRIYRCGQSINGKAVS